MKGKRTWIGSNKFAAVMEVAAITVVRWCKEGKLTYFTTPGGHHRIPIQVAQEFLKKYGPKGAKL